MECGYRLVAAEVALATVVAVMVKLGAVAALGVCGSKSRTTPGVLVREGRCAGGAGGAVASGPQRADVGSGGGGPRLVEDGVAGRRRWRRGQ